MNRVNSRTILIIVGAAIVVLLFGGLGILWAEREWYGDNFAIVEEQLGEAVTVNEEQKQAIDELAANTETLREQLLKEGIEPDAPPPSDVVEDLPEFDRSVGEPIPPTDDQVQAAVEVVLNENPDMITSQVIAEVARQLLANPPLPGEPGADATAAMAFQAVVAFCSGPDDPCRGDDGADGIDGVDGQDGQDGVDAVITQAMVDAALADFCTTNPEACQGPTGPVGATGATGRGLVSIICNDDGVLIATYDAESTTQIIEGSVCQFPPGQGGKD